MPVPNKQLLCKATKAEETEGGVVMPNSAGVGCCFTVKMAGEESAYEEGQTIWIAESPRDPNKTTIKGEDYYVITDGQVVYYEQQ